MLVDPAAQPAVATIWGHLLSDCPREFPPLVSNGSGRPESWQEAVVAFLSKLTKSSHVVRFVNQHRDQLRSFDRTWNAVGDALGRLGQYKLAAQWLAEWRGREAADAEVMLRGADAMFRCGRADECRQIHEHFESSSNDLVGARHGLWLAADDVVVGRMNNARERMQRVPVRDLPVEEQPVYAFVEAAIRIDGGTEGSSTSDYRSARTLIEDA